MAWRIGVEEEIHVDKEEKTRKKILPVLTQFQFLGEYSCCLHENILAVYMSNGETTGTSHP